jgi:uncharacterized protein YbgA (DUF1722 family)/uncharacterized protein YbbK (DUF523 family)
VTLGVSECLLGVKCRYDGGHSKESFISDTLSRYFTFKMYCPEKMIFPTPREAIRLVQIQENIRVFTSNTNEDVTQRIEDISLSCAQDIENQELCGFILKSKSPTCGLERVKVYAQKQAPSEKKGVGIFAKNLKKLYPYLPLEEEGRLNDPWLRENFLMQVFAYEDLLQLLKSKPDFSALVAFHTSYKYLIYAKSHVRYKNLGNIVANHDKLPLKRVLLKYQKEFLQSIALKGSVNKTYNVLLHMFGYFKKYLDKQEKEEILETLEDYKKKIIPLVAVMKIISLYANKFDIDYLKTQKFLKPYPKELALRSDIKAYK